MGCFWTHCVSHSSSRVTRPSLSLAGRDLLRLPPTTARPSGYSRFSVRFTTLQLALVASRDLSKDLEELKYGESFKVLKKDDVPLSDDPYDVFKVYVTGLNRSSGSERESLSKGSAHVNEKVQTGADRTLLREFEVEIANGKTTPQACMEAKITVQ